MEFTLYTGDHQGDPTRQDYPYNIKVTGIEELKKATKNDHTAIDFGGNHRGKKNFISSCCILGDVDNSGRIPEYWVDLNTIKETFKNYAFAVTPSRNSNKEKGDETPRPKWHIYFPVPEITDFKKYERVTTLLHDRFESIGFDSNVKDAARFFYGYGDQKEGFFIQDGKPITAALGGRPKGTGKPKIAPWRDLSTYELAENPQLIPDGERYEVHKILAMYWANLGKNEAQITQLLIDYNTKMPHPREMFTPKVKLQTENLASSAVTKIKQEGGPNPDLVFNRIRNFSYAKGESETKKIAVRSTTPEMKKAMSFFVVLVARDGGRALTLRDNPAVIITKPAQLSTALESVNFIWDVRAIPGALTKDDILSRFQTNSEEITRMTCTPENPLEKGTLFVPQIKFPEAQKTGAFREYLKVFSFKSTEDEYRFAAGILSMFLPARFDGKVPMFALLADAQNAGKTTVVREAVHLTTGLHPIEQKGGKFNQADDHAQFGGVIGYASRGVLYDNLTHLNTEDETAIARAITDTYRSAWSMGISRGHIRNSYVYFATFNDSEGFGRDLQERVVAIRMMDPENVDMERRNLIMEQLNHWRGERDTVIADILRLMDVPLVRIGHGYESMSKYPEWTQRIVGPLREIYPEVDIFNFTPSRGDHRINPGGMVVMEFAEQLFADNADAAVRDIAGGWRLDYTVTGLFEHFSLFSPDAARGFSLRQFLQMVGQYTGGSGEVKIRKRKHHGRMSYEIWVDDGLFNEIRGRNVADSVEY